VRSEAVLLGVKEDRNVIHTIIRRKANWIGDILHRNCLLKHIIEGGIEMARRQGRICKQLLDDFRETRGYRKLKEEAINHTVCRTGFGRVYGPLIRHTIEYRTNFSCS
jgi:hypothetical protein